MHFPEELHSCAPRPGQIKRHEDNTPKSGKSLNAQKMTEFSRPPADKPVPLY